MHWMVKNIATLRFVNILGDSAVQLRLTGNPTTGSLDPASLLYFPLPRLHTGETDAFMVSPNRMSALLRSVFTLAVLLLAFGLLTEAFHLMNQPSDRMFLGGIAMILGLILAVPMIVHVIWSKLK